MWAGGGERERGGPEPRNNPPPPPPPADPALKTVAVYRISVTLSDRWNFCEVVHNLLPLGTTLFRLKNITGSIQTRTSHGIFTCYLYEHKEKQTELARYKQCTRSRTEAFCRLLDQDFTTPFTATSADSP